MIDKLKRKLAMLSLALSKVEKSTLNEESGGFDSDSMLSQTMNQGTMADALLKGEINAEVRDLRWRTYKILNSSENLKTKITGYDKDGLPITVTDNKRADEFKLKSVRLDPYDDYEAEIIQPNDDGMIPTVEVLSNENLKEKSTEELEKYDLVGMEDSNGDTLAELSFDDMLSTMKTDKIISIGRELRPKFEIENFTKKLVVRNINNTRKLLEFYISKYPDEYDRKSRLMISEIKKIMKNPRSSNILDINTVTFISNKAIGSPNGIQYKYGVSEFDKVIEYNGHYVIKFIALPLEKTFIFDKYVEDALEERYRKKEAKKQGK